MAKKSLAAGFTGDVAEETGVSARTKSAVHHVKDEAGMVGAHAVDHPAATGSAIAVIGLLGLAIGYMLGMSSASRDRRWYRQR
ncbi:hypothetical protein [Neorhizobium galegae]|uniref:Uncharacterized protein n=1 Tax=Neorhizobium galegae bv. orientalis str. HAMBI 540 TaxID=1028800 RepID=A0A068SX77_NEOGA|nr:hypothetical protein [Neorhizobium galegae]CDN50449.1 Hypothetical protein RG540_CH43070 [Neorhizobium galegae bv. orientalis str. HAMBI 540]CDZ48789.1 Hypothetical protein NGAL_HAMBI2427_28510 [Neorhizobium galegae bv. orientalis]